jgi:hypothetical protein
VKRDEPVDYEDGFDAVQLGKLISKEMFPKKSSDEKCWYAIFKLLFPDWPTTEEIPNPCEYLGLRHTELRPKFCDISDF